MHNGFDKNKRIFPIACIIKKTPIALPPANVNHLSFNGHVTGCICKLCTTARLAIGATAGGKGPGQDGWESVDGVDEGPVQHNFDNLLAIGLATVEAMNNEGPIQQTVPWPDGGINNPTRARKPLSLIQIAEASPVRQSVNGVLVDKPIETESPTEAFHRTSIDKPDLLTLAQLVEDAAEQDDDQNNWGGLDTALAEGLRQIGMGVEDEETKYGPGNYPNDDNDTSYRTPEFYHSIFTEKNSPYLWMIPNVIAIGPHPIFSSHLDNLSVFKEGGFKAIVSVFDKQLEPKQVKGFHYFFVKTAEGHSNDLDKICRFIDTQEKLGNPVFIHSFTGKGRCATVAAAYFVHKGWLTAEEAIEWVREHVGDEVIETIAQEDAVIKFSIDKT